jgi:arabinan endo-1,5-alpha-L-arabinosidase
MKEEAIGGQARLSPSSRTRAHVCILTAIRTTLLVLLFSCVTNSASALHGAIGIHDPSSIIQRNGVYHLWGTGNQIYHLTSTDLVGWTVAPTVFPAGQWPAWINSYVPGFSGHFWAPEIFFLNGKYYVYYSCSTFGSRISAIGLATSTDLTTWTDQGMVVFSNDTTPYNAIDAAVFQDANRNLWLVFGSHWSGIWMAQLDPTTGKRLNSTLTNVVPVNDAEAGFVIRRDGFYYLFYNRGICCAGTNSTYNILVGRSTNPTGPYVDRNGSALGNNSGTPFLSTSGRYIGPGHAGHFAENGVEYLSYHFYDGNLNGTPLLRLSNIRWDEAGWPVASADWITNGRYKIMNQGNSLVWEDWGCTGSSLEPIAQGNYTGSLCQQWDLTSLGNGAYKITSAQGGLAANVINCSSAAGAKLDIFAFGGSACQQFNIERASDGSYVIAAVNGNHVIDVPFATTVIGTQLQTWFYNGFSAQKWLIRSPVPVLLTEVNTPRAVALDSVTMMRDPIPFRNVNNFSSDQRTRLTIFAEGLELMPGENASIITAQVEDSQLRVYPVTIEYVGRMPNFDWLSQVVVRLPDEIERGGDVWFNVRLRGATSNKVLVSIK